MDTRRSFLKKASFISGSTGLLQILPGSILQAMAIDPAPGSTYLDAEHIVFLMQENRSFDHTYGSLQGVRGFNDPRAIRQPNNNLAFLQSDKHGDIYPPFRLDIKDTRATWMSSLPHSWTNQVDARNEGHFDKWLEVKPSWKDEYDGMPLTLGYHSREDIPFYYALADAFTVCDQHFCSSLTGTTPNRLYFWTGTIRPEPAASAMAHVWNEDADLERMVTWGTFPERLEKNGIPWKVYQNEITADTGFVGEQDPWLGNFGDNPLEYLTQYNVKLNPRYIAQLPNAAINMQKMLAERKTKLAAASTADAEKLKKEIAWLEKGLLRNAEEQKIFTTDKYEALSGFEKSIHEKAFSTNHRDPFFRELDELVYQDGAIERKLQMPKGDILHQFREDVNQGKLPTVSWLVAPENFSDHPSAAWYGAWYISEVMDILTKNPEVWKKTIFVLTYDENDGYFDHVPPFVAPHPSKDGTGKVSKGIDTSLEYVADESQQSKTGKEARVSPIGLGFRVPMVVASPWSRGGWVNSQVFDHTSALQFLEHFLSEKYKKPIREENISAWRRTVCGDLRSIFRPWNGEKLTSPSPLEKNDFLESIHKAQFKGLPTNYRKLNAEEIKNANQNPGQQAFMPRQEKGIRPSCALPYELQVIGQLDKDRKTFRILFAAGTKQFGKLSAGAPFQVYARQSSGTGSLSNRNYAVAAGDSINDQWSLDEFEGKQYDFEVYGPNGFYRQFKGDHKDELFDVSLGTTVENSKPNQPTGNLIIAFANKEKRPLVLEITRNGYAGAPQTINLGAAGSSSANAAVDLDLQKNYSWYDFTVMVKGNSHLQKRYAGRVETGKEGKTDPMMGGLV